jgi:hypothetical protein
VRIVLYCNGPYSGKSKRLAAELVAGGYSRAQRYQLGIPVWRALGGVTQIVVIGGAVPARYVAVALAREAFHNVSYFAGSLGEARAALKP